MKPVKEALKEAARLMAFAALAAAVTYFGSIDAQWAIALTFVLRALDKYVHENENIPLKGLLFW